MYAYSWQAFGFRKRRFRDLEFVQPGTKIQQQLRVEAGSDLAREHEIVCVVIPHQKCAKSDAAALRICESANDEFLSRLAFHLEPMRRASMLIQGRPSLGNHSFPSFAAGACPGFVVRNFRNMRKRSTERQIFE